MKKLNIIILACIIASTFLACKKDLESPDFNGLVVYQSIPNSNKFEKLTAPYAVDSSKQTLFLVKTKKPYVVVWPGERKRDLTVLNTGTGYLPSLVGPLKSKLNPANDSVKNGVKQFADSVYTVNGVAKVVHKSGLNNNFEDKGWPNALGLSATRTDSGYIYIYTYSRKGSYKAYIQVSNANRDEHKFVLESADFIVK